jgi:hypothetical protein
MTQWPDFDLIQISCEKMKSVFVPPNVWGDQNGRYVSFADYLRIPSTDAADARNVPSDPEGPLPSQDGFFCRFSTGGINQGIHSFAICASLQ